MNCALCKEILITSSKKAQFCSKKCKDKNWYLENKKKKDAYGAIYYRSNKKDIDARHKKNSWKYKKYQRVANKEWREANPNYQNDYVKERKRRDINFRLSISLRTRLNSAIKNNYKSGSAVKDLGCSIDELKKHLESQFKSGMNWSNWSRDGWHIDHIKPLASFNLTKREELEKACHYTNLQPMWAEDNLSKGNKNE